jgi:hypothetical protein
LLFHPIALQGHWKEQRKDQNISNGLSLSKWTIFFKFLQPSQNMRTLSAHGQDCSHHSSQSPDLVVWPSKVEEVQEIARFCSSQRIPMIPYGTGTGLEG